MPVVRRGRHAHGEHGKVELPLEGLAEERILTPHQEPLGPGTISATFARVKSTPFSWVSSIEFLSAPGMGAHIHVEGLDV